MWTLSSVLCNQPPLTALCSLLVFHSLMNIWVSSVSQTQCRARVSSELCRHTFKKVNWGCLGAGSSVEATCSWDLLPKGKAMGPGCVPLVSCIFPASLWECRQLPQPNFCPPLRSLGEVRGELKSSSSKGATGAQSHPQTSGITEKAKKKWLCLPLSRSPFGFAICFLWGFLFCFFNGLVWHLFIIINAYGWRIIHVHPHKTGKNTLS